MKSSRAKKQAMSTVMSNGKPVEVRYKKRKKNVIMTDKKPGPT